MTINIWFDHIDDAEIEIKEISEEQEEQLLMTLLAFCNAHFDVDHDEEEE